MVLFALGAAHAGRLPDAVIKPGPPPFPDSFEVGGTCALAPLCALQEESAAGCCQNDAHKATTPPHAADGVHVLHAVRDDGPAAGPQVRRR